MAYIHHSAEVEEAANLASNILPFRLKRMSGAEIGEVLRKERYRERALKTSRRPSRNMREFCDFYLHKSKLFIKIINMNDIISVDDND